MSAAQDYASSWWKRNPMHTTTFGVGELIKDAIDNGCRHFIVRWRKCHWNDGGIGMLQALGYDFLDKDGAPVAYGRRRSSNRCAHQAKMSCRIKRLYFPRGVWRNESALWSDGDRVRLQSLKRRSRRLKELDEALLLRRIIRKALTMPLRLCRYRCSRRNGILHSNIHKCGSWGIKIVLEETGLEDREMKDADFVITGEGRLNSQTTLGKLQSALLILQKKHDEESRLCRMPHRRREYVTNGIDAFFPILRRSHAVQAMERNAREIWFAA